MTAFQQALLLIQMNIGNMVGLIFDFGLFFWDRFR
jgi:hypothetical protein